MSGVTALEALMLDKDASNPPIITAMLAFDSKNIVSMSGKTAISDDEREQVVNEFARSKMVHKLAQAPRFRVSGLVLQGGGRLPKDAAEREAKRELDEAYHFRSHALPARNANGEDAENSHREFEQTIEEIQNEDLDHSRPLWRVHVIHNVRFRDAIDMLAAVVILRIHHAIADGISLLELLIHELMDTAKTGERSPNGTPAEAQPKPGIVMPNLNKSKSARRSSPSERAAREGSTASNGKRHGDQKRFWAFAPFRKAARFLRRAMTHVVFAAHAVIEMFVLLWISDRRSPLLAPPGIPLSGKKIILSGRHVPIAPLKQAAKAAGMTFTELVLVAISGGLRRYFAEQGTPRTRAVIACLPFSFREVSRDSLQSIGNDVTTVFVPLAAHCDELHERVAVVRKALYRVRFGYSARLARFAQLVLALMPRPIRSRLWKRASRHPSLLVSTLPAPSHEVSVAGAPVHSITYWAPSTALVPSAFSCIGYGGSMWFGFLSDRAAVPDPRSLLDNVYVELDHILSLHAPPSDSAPSPR
mmetsp:Transcript_6420/g.17199  ORF Transcript_6420/g.17199 Transcript_6420/m.17199 type:complete len:531 (-) Transcript_6420:99-1691(-)